MSKALYYQLVTNHFGINRMAGRLTNLRESITKELHQWPGSEPNVKRLSHPWSGISLTGRQSSAWHRSSAINGGSEDHNTTLGRQTIYHLKSLQVLYTPCPWIWFADNWSFKGITSEGNADLSKQVPETSTWGNLPGQNENNRSAWPHQRPYDQN